MNRARSCPPISTVPQSRCRSRDGTVERRLLSIKLLLSALVVSLSSPLAAGPSGVPVPTHLVRSVDSARQELAAQLGAVPEVIEVASLQESGSGYRLVLRALGAEQAYQIDHKGVARMLSRAAPELPSPVAQVRQDLASHLRLPASEVKVVRLEKRLWPDTCLGLPAPDMCVPGETRGYRILLRTLGHEYVYHSDEKETFRFTGPGDTPQRPARREEP
jgi:hypothetical protein